MLALDLDHLECRFDEGLNRRFPVGLQYKARVAEPFDVSEHHVGNNAVFVSALAWDDMSEYGFVLQAAYGQALHYLPFGPCFLKRLVGELEFGSELHTCLNQEEVLNGHNGDK